MTFDRWIHYGKKTWLHANFKSYHTELNRLYWTQHSTNGTFLNQLGKAIDTSPVLAHIVIGSDEERRVPQSVGEYKGAIADASNWIRLNTAMALNAYLEVYLHDIYKYSLLSNPGLLINSAKGVDGIAQIKHSRTMEVEDKIKRLNSLDWRKRAKKVKALFGVSIAYVDSNIRDLERLRKLRNGVGHGFGRDLDALNIAFDKTKIKMERLSHEKLISIFVLVDNIVSEVDGTYRSSHLGNFEILLEYDKWIKGKPRIKESMAADFKTHLHQENRSAPSKTFLKAMIRYYDGL